MSATLTVERQNPLSFGDSKYGAQYISRCKLEGGLSFRYKPKGADDSVYSPVEPTQAGEYVVRAQSLETINYYAATVTREFTINKADYNMSGVTFEDATYTYDGEEKTLTISGTLPAGVSVSYSQNALTDAGFIEVVASFEGDYLNYNHISAKIAILTINKAENPVIISVSDSVIGNDLNITIENNLGERR